MNRFGKTAYEQMPWAGGKTPNFTKPRFEDIETLKGVPLGDRLPEYSEFYELQTYLDVLGHLEPGDMLDAGAGSGSLSWMFTHLGWNVISCDFDPHAFRFVDGAFTQVDLNKGLPFSSGQFSCIVCKQVIEHLENPNYLIREFRRMLKSGGTVMFSTPNIASLRARFTFLRTGVPAFFENYWLDHRTILHYGQLRSMLEEHRFSDVQCHTNRYEMFNMNARVNGKRMRFLSPILKFSAPDRLPEACRFGEYLILSARTR